ncbi:hypothetical protein FB45DRAFT_934378 [Roridomyces roridus]|uniref:FAD/NAD(P)-binding domain-containing protein n=1 Tax=Roridomyces roridus TaxID=1738132 RepID=A0AAD7BBW4_9AGAR|nr:hypothetical protein FB45DRAFT_934378 [Roridomyces roridus]
MTLGSARSALSSQRFKATPKSGHAFLACRQRTRFSSDRLPLMPPPSGPIASPRKHGDPRNRRLSLPEHTHTKNDKTVLILGRGVAGVIAARTLPSTNITNFLIIEARVVFAYPLAILRSI